MPVTDFSEVKTNEVVPAGNYVLQCVKIEEKQSQSSEYLYGNVEWEVILPEEYAETKIWDIYSLSPKAAFKIMELLKASGLFDEEFDVEEGEPLPTIKWDWSNFFEKDKEIQVNAVIYQEMYNGDMKNKVKSISKIE